MGAPYRPSEPARVGGAPFFMQVKGEREGSFEMFQKHCVIVTAGIGGYEGVRAMGFDLAEFPVDPDR